VLTAPAEHTPTLSCNPVAAAKVSLGFGENSELLPAMSQET
jgi:hypothetical protein